MKDNTSRHVLSIKKRSSIAATNSGDNSSVSLLRRRKKEMSGPFYRLNAMILACAVANEIFVEVRRSDHRR